MKNVICIFCNEGNTPVLKATASVVAFNYLRNRCLNEGHGIPDKNVAERYRNMSVSELRKQTELILEEYKKTFYYGFKRLGSEKGNMMFRKYDVSLAGIVVELLTSRNSQSMQNGGWSI